MKQFIESVVDSIVQRGLVEVEVSSETSAVSAGTVFK